MSAPTGPPPRPHPHPTALPHCSAPLLCPTASLCPSRRAAVGSVSLPLTPISLFSPFFFLLSSPLPSLFALLYPHPTPRPPLPTAAPPTRAVPADPPRDVTLTTFLDNREGRWGAVLCTASSRPPAALSLFRRGLLVASSLGPHGAPGLRVAASPNALRVDMGALRRGDAAEFRCTARNALGNASATAYFETRSEGRGGGIWGGIWGGVG